MESDLGTSPKSVFEYLRSVGGRQNRLHSTKDDSVLTLDCFVEQLPRLIEARKSSNLESSTSEDALLDLVRRVELSSSELENFALFDCSRGYTRNLIATDYKSFTLLLLCWTPGKFSPIHDHPCDGCWMKVLEGQVQEYRYTVSEVDGSMECIQDTTCRSGQVLYIEDSMGLHKVGNPSATERAVTLHVYSPPFAECKIWLDEDRSPNRVTIQHFSEYGLIL